MLFLRVFVGQRRWTPALGIIREAVVLKLFPPIQPEADAVTILLVDVSNLIQRISARAEQHRVRSHSSAMHRISLLNFLESLLLRSREWFNEFGRRSHSLILPENICVTT